MGEKVRNERLIIGLSGKAGTGKSTAATYLVSFLREKGFPARKASFASTLREECAATFPVLDWYQKPTPELTRRMLRCWGQVRREENPNYWVRALMKRIDYTHIFVIDDLRFLNEAMYLRTEENSILLRMEIHGDNPLEVTDDISETDLDTFDYFDGYMRFDYGALEKFADIAWQHIRANPFIMDTYARDDA